MDSVEILKSFADRSRNMIFPCFADPESKTIREYGVLNTAATGQLRAWRGRDILHRSEGVIREKFFEVKYEKDFPETILLEDFSRALGDEVTDKVEAPHLALTVVNNPIAPLFPAAALPCPAEVQLPTRRARLRSWCEGYKPIALTMDPAPDLISPRQLIHAKRFFIFRPSKNACLSSKASSGFLRN